MTFLPLPTAARSSASAAEARFWLRSERESSHRPRDQSVVSSRHCMGMTPSGGSHGNQHPTARVHCHAWQRSSRMADRGAGAVGGDAGDRVCSRQNRLEESRMAKPPKPPPPRPLDRQHLHRHHDPRSDLDSGFRLLQQSRARQRNGSRESQPSSVEPMDNGSETPTTSCASA